MSGVDRAAQWSEVSVGSLEAFGEPEVLSRHVALTRGPTPARQYLLEMTFDLIVHSWDLGTAIGYPGSLPEGPAEFLYERVQRWGDLSGSGMFDEPVHVPHDLPPIDKLIALTGRNPR